MQCLDVVTELIMLAECKYELYSSVCYASVVLFARLSVVLKPVHTGDKSCRKRRQIVARNGNKSRCFRQLLSPVWTAYESLSTLATKVAENGDKLSPKTATNVAENCNKSRCFRQHLFGNFCRQCGQAIICVRVNGGIVFGVFACIYRPHRRAPGLIRGD